MTDAIVIAPSTAAAAVVAASATTTDLLFVTGMLESYIIICLVFTVMMSGLYCSVVVYYLF